jgi:hypothetical protein
MGEGGGAEVQFIRNLSSCCEWSALRPCRFTSSERTYCWVDLRVGLDDVEKKKFLTLTGLEFRPLGRPVRSQSLYRLRYPGSLSIDSN